jgi:endonuclease YncB( thermonuclease family)
MIKKINWTMVTMLLIATISIYYQTRQETPYSQVICYDGDTFATENASGRVYFRLAFIDTPEKGQPGYREASFYTCQSVKDVINREVKAKFIYHGKDKYHRRLTEIVYEDGWSLNEELILIDLAEPFYGKTTDKILKLYEEVKRR